MFSFSISETTTQSMEFVKLNEDLSEEADDLRNGDFSLKEIIKNKANVELKSLLILSHLHSVLLTQSHSKLKTFFT